MATDTKLTKYQDVQQAMRGQEPDVVEAIDRLDSAAIDPVVAIEAVTGMRADSLLYKFPLQGKEVIGITVGGAKAMMSARGGFEVYRPEFEECEVPVANNDGDWVNVPGIRAIVRVHDKRQDVTFIGVAEEAAVMVKRDGTQRLNPMASRVAASKATRNAALDHFTRVQDVIEKFAAQAIADKRVYVMGESDAQAEEVSRALDVQRAKRTARGSMPTGTTWAEIMASNIKRTAEESNADPEKLTARFLAAVEKDWPGQRPHQIPASEKPKYEAWLDEMRRDLGLSPIYARPEAPPEPDADPEPDNTTDAPEPEQKPAPAAKPTPKAAKPNGNGGSKPSDAERGMF